MGETGLPPQQATNETELFDVLSCCCCSGNFADITLSLRKVLMRDRLRTMLRPSGEPVGNHFLGRRQGAALLNSNVPPLLTGQHTRMLDWYDGGVSSGRMFAPQQR